MPEYPLSSNLLALLSGSFYGTAGTQQERKARSKRRDEERKKTEKELEKVENDEEQDAEAGEVRVEMEYQNGGESKPRDKISLCAPRTGARRGNVVLVSYFANPAIIFYTAPPAPPSSTRLTRYIRGSENLSFFCYLTFRILDFPFSPVFSGYGSSSVLKDSIRPTIH